MTIFQVGEAREVPYIVMELLAGESLDGRLRREKSLPLGEALRFTREVAEGLAVVHERGLVHRDIKPPNVFLEQGTGGEAGGRVKLLDFGVALSGAFARANDVAGTDRGHAGLHEPGTSLRHGGRPRSDLFSLGCLLYAMLAGESPFRRSTDMGTLQAVVTDPSPSIEEKLPHLPAPIARLLAQLLEKEPDARPRSADAVVEAMRNFERELTVAGSPTAAFGSRRRLRKQWTKQRLLGWSGRPARRRSWRPD